MKVSTVIERLSLAVVRLNEIMVHMSDRSREFTEFHYNYI